MRNRIIGLAMTLLGATVLAALGVAIYRRDTVGLLVELGIPGALLAALVGVALVLAGGAAVLGGPRGNAGRR